MIRSGMDFTSTSLHSPDDTEFLQDSAFFECKRQSTTDGGTQGEFGIANNLLQRLMKCTSCDSDGIGLTTKAICRVAFPFIVSYIGEEIWCWQSSGCSSAWLERLLWEQEVVGSNPITPTIVCRTIDHSVTFRYSAPFPKKTRVQIPLNFPKYASKTRLVPQSAWHTSTNWPFRLPVLRSSLLRYLKEKGREYFRPSSL
jgi:hypothetical protein